LDDVIHGCLFLGDGATARTREQLNVLAGPSSCGCTRRTSWLPNQFFPLPACQDFICDSTGYLTSREIRALRTDSRVRASSLPSKRNDWSDGFMTPWPAYRSASADTLTGSGHLSSNSVMAASHPSVYANDDAALRMHRNRVPPVTATATGSSTMAPSVSDAPPRTPETDTAALRCIIITGIENWFLTGDTTTEHCRRTVEQISWFQEVLKVKDTYRTKEWTSGQEVFFQNNSSHHRPHSSHTNSNRPSSRRAWALSEN
jgi:hypothetical protein